MKRLTELTDAILDRFLQSAPQVLLHFGTDWCAPCKRQEKVLREFWESTADLNIRIAKVNVEDAPVLARKYSVTKNPTLLLLQNSSEIARHEGFLAATDLLAFVRGNTD